MKAGTVTTAVAIVLALASAGAGAAAPSVRWIVFPASPQHGTQPSQLFRISTTGNGLDQITTGARAADEPSFSPDGRRVVFTRVRAGIFVVNVDGRGLHRLTQDPNDRLPVWSPDGRHVAFVHPGARRARLAVIGADGDRQRILRQGPEPLGRPSWTPDGRSLVIAAANGSLFRLNARSGAVERRLGLRFDQNGGTPLWTLSPDGRTAAIVGRRAGPPGCTGLACEAFGLFVAPVSSGRLRLLTDEAAYAGWTPDGRRVVYASGAGLRIRAVAGGSVRTIALGSGGEIQPEGDAPPAWQPGH